MRLNQKIHVKLIISILSTSNECRIHRIFRIWNTKDFQFYHAKYI